MSETTHLVFSEEQERRLLQALGFNTREEYLNSVKGRIRANLSGEQQTGFERALAKNGLTENLLSRLSVLSVPKGKKMLLLDFVLLGDIGANQEEILKLSAQVYRSEGLAGGDKDLVYATFLMDVTTHFFPREEYLNPSSIEL